MNKFRVLLILKICLACWLIFPSPVQATECGLFDVDITTQTTRIGITLDEAVPTGGLSFLVKNVTTGNFIIGTFMTSQTSCVASPGSCVTPPLSYALAANDIQRAPNDSYEVSISSDPTPADAFNGDTTILCASPVALVSLGLNDLSPPEIIPESPTGYEDISEGVSAENLDSLNPLKLFSTGVDENLATPGGILTRVLRFAFPIAGLILFTMLVWSGFEILSGATDKKTLDAGKQRATTAIVGFGLLFVSYFLAQLLQVVFGITIL